MYIKTENAHQYFHHYFVEEGYQKMEGNENSDRFVIKIKLLFFKKKVHKFLGPSQCTKFCRHCLPAFTTSNERKHYCKLCLTNASYFVFFFPN